MYGVVGTDGVVYGPVPVTALFDWIAQGRIVPGTILIDYQGRQITASMLPELQGAFPMQSQPYANPFAAPFAPPSKRKSVALLLAFLLGFLGAHRFYLGHTRSGLAMLALNLIAFRSSIEMAILIEIVATVWLISDMAMIGAGKLVGVDGRPLG